MNNKNIISVSFGVLAIVCVLWYSQSGKNEDIVHVAIQQTTSHIVYDNIVKGVREGLKDGGYVEGKNLIVDLQNGQGDESINQSIAKNFSKVNYDIYVPLGTQASQSIANVVKEKPIVFSAVYDPVAAKLVSSINEPGNNITGTTDALDYKQQLTLFKKAVPNLKKVGLLYNASEVNSVSTFKKIQAYGPELGLEFVVAPITSTNDILISARSIVSKVDGFYTMPDNTLISGEESLIKVALENKKPVFDFENSGVEKGGLMAIGTNYEKIGYKTGLMAVRVLKGEDTATMPVESLTNDDIDLYLNQKTADRLGIKFPEELVKQAKEIYR